jgi:hypothetical protein
MSSQIEGITDFKILPIPVMLAYVKIAEVVDTAGLSWLSILVLKRESRKNREMKSK